MRPLLFTTCLLIAIGGFSQPARISQFPVSFNSLAADKNVITGILFFDFNNNTIQDAGEPALSNFDVRTSKFRQDVITNTVDGIYSNFVDTGTYTTSPRLADFPYYVAVPDTQSVTFSSLGNTIIQNFAIQKIAEARDYTVSLEASAPARPGARLAYKIFCRNKGTDTILNKTVAFVKDSRLQLVQTDPMFEAVSGDTIFWKVDNVGPGGRAVLQIDMMNTANIGDTLQSKVSIDNSGDSNTDNNSDTLWQQVVGSFDAVGKTEKQGDYILLTAVQSGQYLEYTIRFQNTGNDSSANITVMDTLDSRLQWVTAEVVNASNPYFIEVTDGRYIKCFFQNILLPDSAVNEPASHGYITYRIRPQTTLMIGDVINNSASVYFDNNAPLKTNTVKTTVIKSEAIWTGTVDSLWDNPGNWNSNLVPDAETVVIIPANVPNNPVVNTNTSCYAVRMDKNAVINITDGYNLEITGK